MANTFKNASVQVNTTPGTVIYSAPSNTTAIIHTLIISNTSLADQTVTVQLVDSSASTSYRIVKDAPVPVGGSISIPKPINLESQDSVRIVASNVSTLEAVASVLEISD